jgi:hypothetical protein
MGKGGTGVFGVTLSRPPNRYVLVELNPGALSHLL